MNGSNEKQCRPQLPSDAAVRHAGESIPAKSFTLVDLDQQQLDSIFRRIPGGAENVADIYPLSPLQEGMLYHHLVEEQDTYILSTLLELDFPKELNALIEALETVIDRYDVLRTAILWEELPRPLQVVCRKAALKIEERELDPSRDTVSQLRALMRPGSSRIDPRLAPMMKVVVAKHGGDNRHHALIQVHHVVCDYQSLRSVVAESLAIVNGLKHELPVPQLYRSYVEDLIAKVKADSGEEFFRRKLGDVAEPTLALDLPGVHGHGITIEEVRAGLGAAQSQALRAVAQRIGVSPARMFHAAMALVVAQTSGRDDVIFGTVVLADQHRHSGRRGMVGMAINTLPLRIKLGGLTARELVDRTHDELLDLVKHEHVSLTTTQRCSGLGPSVSLFNTLLNFRHSAIRPGRDSIGASAVRVIESGEAWSNYSIAVTVDDLGETFSLIAQLDHRLIGRPILKYFSTALESLIEALTNAPETPVHQITVIPRKERDKIVELFNDTRSQYPKDKLIHKLFEHCVERSPAAIALSCDGEYITYSALNGMANRLARYLTMQGVAAGEFLPIIAPRSRDMVVAQLAVLKAGGIYVPVDPLLPADRQVFMIRDCGALHALFSDSRSFSFDVPGLQNIALADALEAACGLPEDNPHLSMPSSVPACVMYTSGSTGTPKGVIVPHHAISRLVFKNGYADFGPDDCFAHTSNPAFDAATFEIWGALLTGARLVIVPQEVLLDSRRFAEVLNTEGVTILWITVGLLKEHLQALTGVIGRLRYMITGGDVVDPALVRRIPPKCRPRHVLNAYGPTECTTFSTTYDIPDIDGEVTQLPIGKPIANTRIYILDQHLQPVPIGVPGEVYIAGDGLALGYLNRPDLTIERFVPDPFQLASGSRMYRSGDLGRWREDGNIEFLGRNDLQVKIRGFRIELGEIEEQLRRCPRISEAVVVAREDVKGDKRLVAYMTSDDSEDQARPSVEFLRANLKERVPDFMMPSAFVFLDRLPLTPNGKIDRRALPTPNLDTYRVRAYEAPQGDLEELIAGVWQKLLRLERVGRRDNFFELGGNSLLVVQMMEHLRRMGLSAQVRCVFDSPTVSGLAGALGEHGVAPREIPPNLIPPACDAITPEMLPLVKLEPQHITRIVQTVPGGVANIQDIYPLAPLQEGMLFHHLLEGSGPDIYVVPILLSFSSRKRLQDFVAALQRVINRHDALRTSLLWEGLPQPIQVVHRGATLTVEEVAHESDRVSKDVLLAKMVPEGHVLDLISAPLMRLRVAPDEHSTEWYALLQLHHLVCDNVSLGAMLREVMTYMEGYSVVLPEPAPYRNHIARILARSRTVDHEAYFTKKFGDVDEPTAPFDRVDARGDAAQFESAHEVIDPGLANRLRAQARRIGVSAATLFHSVWFIVLSNVSGGRDDVVFGSVFLGRLQGNIDAWRPLGLFINTMPLRQKLRGMTAEVLVEETQRQIVELLGHEDAPLAIAQRCSSVPSGVPLFNTLLNYRHRTVDLVNDFGSTPGLRVLAARSWTNYPVVVSIDEGEDEFTVTAQTEGNVDPRRVVGYVRTGLQSLIDALESSPDTEALSLTILPADERLKILEAFNDTEVEYPEGKLIHELFQQQVARTPDAVAVEHEGRRLTYAQLNRRANQLARYLMSRGVSAGDLVGVCMERGLEMIVGVLGLLKAGGAYLPLDPNYPADRLRMMLDDATPHVVVTETELLGILPATDAELVALDEKLGRITPFIDEDLNATELELVSENLVYVIYTSGSTGRPKGTAMTHRSMVNLIEWHRRSFSENLGTRVLQFAALSFDVAFQEIFSTLCTGGTLVLLDEWVRRDGHALAEFLGSHSIQRLFLPPLMLQSLAECCVGAESAPTSLRDIIVAGEQLRISPEIVSLFRRLNGGRLHNHYGPTETHVVTGLTMAGSPEHWPMLPSIGRPISNAQVYVLSGERRPVPIGVKGEIYIGGAGVARGYLGKSELTAQRFIENPFSSKSGARLYRTGDVGRWRADGTLEYMGRNDFQVKIRGYRIELGEIEAQLARHTNVKEAAVVEREDQPGRKRLVAYVTLRGGSGSSVEELQAHLKGVLPEYMMPSVIVILDRLPLTPSGKLDRRALPAPQLNAYVKQGYEAPQGEVEEVLAGIWQELLQIERADRNDNFFDLGGHSLLAMKAIAKINESLNTSLRVFHVYQSAVLRELAEYITKRTDVDAFIDLASEARLDDDIAPSPRIESGNIRSVLLTGATGFVGRFLLAQLLQDSNATIYCLVRAKSEQEAAARIQGTLTQWDLWRADYEGRIISVPGDLQRPSLGLSEANYRLLVGKAGSIYHCGASVNHLENYDSAKAANVTATQELLRIATHGTGKPLHYVSTLGIFTNHGGAGPRVVAEDSPIEHEAHRRSSGYVGSKWVAEEIIMTAQARGVPCNIIRLGLLWADARQGRFDKSQHVYRLIKTCLLAGYGIQNYSYQRDPVPVDYAARAIVALSARPVSGSIYHITAPSQACKGLFEQCNDVLINPLTLKPWYEWVAEIKRIHDAGGILPIVPLIEFAFSLDQRELIEHLRREELARVHPRCERTYRELELADIFPPPRLDSSLVALCLKDMLWRDPDLWKISGQGIERISAGRPDVPNADAGEGTRKQRSGASMRETV